MLKKALLKTGFVSHSIWLLTPTPFQADVQVRYTATISTSFIADTVDTGVNRTVDTTMATSPDSASRINTVTVAYIKPSKYVAKYVESFLKREDESLQKIRGKSPTYFRIIDKVFTEYDLPLELKYLAVVESDLNTKALSRVGARGIWQLMPVTARELGLKVSGSTDERTHVYKSTVAVAKYLRYLYAQFDDWLLVMAAYNSGPGTVLKAIKTRGTRNFWLLQNHLPQESKLHVKRFIGVHYFFEENGSDVTKGS